MQNSERAGDDEMIGKTLRRFWTHLLITFCESYTAEGFEKTNKKFELPVNLVELDPATKRQLTICNLFANQKLSIFEIVKVLDSSLHQVVPTLIENGLIKERRRHRSRGRMDSGKANRSTTLSILPSEAKAEETSAGTEPRSNTAKFSLQDDTGGRSPSPDIVQNGRRMAS
jgi:hypothetical protein